MFPECDDCFAFDMINGDYDVLDNFDTFCMFRIQTEFDVATWKNIFKKVSSTKVKTVFFIPSEIMTIKDVVRERLLYLRMVITGQKPIFCGYYYDEKEMQNFWGESMKLINKVYLENTVIYVMERRNIKNDNSTY